MSMLSKNARLRFTLNNSVVDAPIEWQDISIQADFENGGVQPTIDIDAFTFVNQEAQTIRDWISAGRIFEGIPFNIDTYNVNSSSNSFKGYINCTNGIELFDVYASILLLLAVMVLVALAVLFSTRFNVVLTILCCTGTFLLVLLPSPSWA